jgi:positive regulator of sigma E activity
MNHKRRQCRVVTQPGVVSALHGTDADIQIVQTSACASCRLRGVCAPGDAAAKMIRVANPGGLVPGSRVDVHMDERFGWMGIIFAFALPLVIVVGTLFGLAVPLGSEEMAAVAGLGALLPYYGLLYVTRGFFSRIVRFDVTPSERVFPGAGLTLFDSSAFHKEGVQ